MNILFVIVIAIFLNIFSLFLFSLFFSFCKNIENLFKFFGEFLLSKFLLLLKLKLFKLKLFELILVLIKL